MVLQSPWTELFKMVELYLGDGLEIAGHLAMMLGIWQGQLKNKERANKWENAVTLEWLI